MHRRRFFSLQRRDNGVVRFRLRVPVSSPRLSNQLAGGVVGRKLARSLESAITRSVAFHLAHGDAVAMPDAISLAC